MSTIHMHQTTTWTPEQYISGLTDFGPGRSKLFGNSADEYLKVHNRGPLPGGRHGRLRGHLRCSRCYDSKLQWTRNSPGGRLKKRFTSTSRFVTKSNSVCALLNS